MLSTDSSADRLERGVVGGSGTRQQRPSGVTLRPDVRQNVTIVNGQVTSYRAIRSRASGIRPRIHTGSPCCLATGVSRCSERS
jgi:hypothetical protein